MTQHPHPDAPAGDLQMIIDAADHALELLTEGDWKAVEETVRYIKSRAKKVLAAASVSGSADAGDNGGGAKGDLCDR